MYKKAVIILSLCFAVLLGLYLNFKLLKKANNDSAPGLVVQTVEVRYDTIVRIDTMAFPVPLAVQPTKRDSIIDTLKLIDDYYSEKQYAFNASDSVLSKSISFKVRKNALFDFKEVITLFPKTTIITNDHYHYPAFTFGIGGQLGYSTLHKTATFNLSALFATSTSGVTIGYEFVNREVNAGYFYLFPIIKKNGNYKILKKLE